MKKAIFNDTPGAMFISRDTNYTSVYTWSALRGIEKQNGCVRFMPVKKGPRRYYSDILHLNPEQCKSTYYDYPEEEEAWLVTPKGKDFLWERVDEQLKLLKW